MEIEVGKFYTTRDGRKVRIYATDGIDNYPIHGAYLGDLRWHSTGWTRNGGYYYGVNQLDIVSEWEEPLDFDWSCLPAWCNNFIAKDENGVWCAYAKAPTFDRTYWSKPSCYMPIPPEYWPKGYTESWHSSLFENPNNHASQG